MIFIFQVILCVTELGKSWIKLKIAQECGDVQWLDKWA